MYQKPSPNEAHTKITCRLVNYQNPENIQGLIKKHLEEQAPKGCTVKVTLQDTGNPFLTPIDDPMIQKAAEAYEKVYGKHLFIKEKAARFRSNQNICDDGLCIG